MKEGGIKERMYAARTGYRAQQDAKMKALETDNQRLKAENQALRARLEALERELERARERLGGQETLGSLREPLEILGSPRQS